ncbi:hypothetical protein I8752_08885 [Nostocaceae cyanobacterium CENA369]|uniref:Uncharacterized protein n=1 Tax=Dendronalium phyllosphericum CENA369 TaxID=1725256 RepID=A0A8J7I3P4_9NOST|nr:hypothetical protein [Dendronalium phyllosphericum]MBH8573128.1 hypothetical protein [Dendronalium phyllosphericum CENA369]
MKISAIVKGSICLLGLVSVGNILAAPASAGQGQASARGAVTIVRPSGSSISVSGELVAAEGTDFSALDVVVNSPAGEGTNQETVGGLTLTPTVTTASTTPPSTIEGAIAAQIAASSFSNVEDLAALVRAAASNGGLE